jgi:DNA polymerase-3 subunit alpha
MTIKFKRCNCSVTPGEFDIHHLPLDCKATYDIICAGLTIGVFQLEKPLGAEWCRKVKPRTISELSDVIALIRPGSLESGQAAEYVRNKFDGGMRRSKHACLDKILARTYGCLVFQEDVLSIAREIAGFSLTWADTLRKSLGKKLPALMAKCKTEFIEGCARVGTVDAKQAEEIFGWIEKGQRYSFNRSHSISYAMLAFQTAYCKAHFPTEFFVQSLIFAANKSDPMEERYILIRDAQNFGITIRPPDIRLKNSDFMIDPTTSNGIIFGLAHIKGISAATIDRLMKLSMGTWGQFVAAIPAIRKNYALALVQSGACDCYGLPRTYMANVVKAVIDSITDREVAALTPLVESSGDISTALKTLAAGGHLTRLNKNRRAVLEGLAETLGVQTPDTTKQRALLEHWYLGASVSCSAADGIMDANDVQRCSDFIKIPNGKSIDLCVVIERVKISKTRKGQAMCFITVSDSSGGIDHCPVFPDTYSTCQDKCQPQAVIVLGGTKRNGSLIVESIRELVGT